MHFAIRFSFTVVGRIASCDGVGIGRLLSVPTPGSLPSTCADRLVGSGCGRSQRACELTVSATLQSFGCTPRLAANGRYQGTAGIAG